MASCGTSANKTIDDNAFANALEDLTTISDAANSSELTASARLAGTVRTLQGRLQEISGFVAINGGVWAAGVDFASVSEYMIYSGVAYKVKAGTALPYTSTATPDSDFVEPFTITFNSDEIYSEVDEYNKTYLGDYTDYTFSTVANMIAATTVGGVVVTFKEGQALKVVGEDNKVKLYVVTTTTTTIDLGSGLYALQIFAVTADEAESSVNPIAALDPDFDARNNPRPGLSLLAVTNADTDLEWAGGTLSLESNIYFFPYNGTTVLKFEPDTSTFSEIGSVTAAQGYTSGVLASDGNIYAASRNADLLLKIDTATDTVTEISGMSASNYGFDGIVAGDDGYVYLVPSLATQVLRFDPVGVAFSYIGSTYSISDGKWAGGCIAGNRRIYCAPFNNANILEIDIASQTTRLIATSGSASSARWKGATLGIDGNVYFMPHDDDSVLVYYPESDTVDYITDPSTGFSKYAGGITAKNGKIYAMPYTASTVLEIDVEAGSASAFTFDAMTSTNKFLGGVMDVNGLIYGCPSNDEQVTLLIQGAQGSYEWQLSAFSNKY